MSAITKYFMMLVAICALVACAATPGRVHQAAQVDEINNQHGLALRGYDPVGYFTEGQPVLGQEAISYSWRGATWRFASAENRDRFMADPDRYAPQFGGYCAYAVSIGTTANGDPHQWAIVADHLFLNNNALAMTLWNQDRPGNIKAGEENWPLIPKQPLGLGEQAVQSSAPTQVSETETMQ